jgi:3-methyladenine DNA glycosylase AlkD
MNQLARVRSQLHAAATIPKEKHTMFFKTGAGDYAEHDRFIGVTMPSLRLLAREFRHLSLPELQQLLASAINEERLLALLILVDQYQKGNAETHEALYNFYMDNIDQVNNWNLVDASAHLIVGDYLYHTKNKNILTTLATSENIWHRRIAIVATWCFIRKQELDWTFKIATMLLTDTHDLIHKAVGWMLREAGKRDQDALIQFLDKHATAMPRTMLRYALEKLPAEQRKEYLMQKIK